jgi:hypothetical protein
MDDPYTPRPLARWFMPAAVVALLFGLLVAFGYGVHLNTNPATLPLDERAIYLAEPSWVSGAFGLTGVATAVGALLLLMRRKAAEWVLLLALAAALVWFAGLLLVPQLRELLESQEIAMAVVVVAIVWTIFWFARHSRMRGWLR